MPPAMTVQPPLSKPHIKTTEEICKYFGVDPLVGLTQDQVELYQRSCGFNELTQSPGKSCWTLIAEQFQDLLTRILLAAAFISFALALIDDKEDGITAFVEPFVILLILAANAAVSVWQESSAEKSLEALKNLQPDLARVLRQGEWTTLNSRDLVPGDIVMLNVGDKAPADLRLLKLKTISMRAEQSQLTGESKSVPKEAVTLDSSFAECELQSKLNMIFASTTIAHGSATAIVIATAMNTEIGKIQSAVEKAGEEEGLTPLQQKLNDFGELLSKGIGVICVLVWLINIKNFSDPSHGGFFKGCIYYFKTAVALAVAAIPEGLTAVITTCLALGTRKLARKNAIVRRLTSVETLGCTTVICSDKTGTLTTNQMRCVQFVVPVKASELVSYDVENRGKHLGVSIKREDKNEGFDRIRPEHHSLTYFAECAALCNVSQLKIRGEEIVESVGEPTEIALKILVEQLKFAKQKRDAQSYLESLYDQVAVLEFTRSRKSMSVIYRSKRSRDQYIQFVKGAPESILDRCTHVVLADNTVVPLNATLTQRIQQYLQAMTSQTAQRVLAMAFKTDIVPRLFEFITRSHNEAHFDTEAAEDPNQFEKFEQDLIFCGLAGLRDPLRPEVADAVALCQKAGIKVIMMTGDNKNTAEAVGLQIGIVDKANIEKMSFSGKEFEDMSDDKKMSILRGSKQGAIFSRTEPRHKQIIVSLMKRMGEVIAMTGDGVNDAPALKQADIGIAMGISGTEVAKEASDMVLADDNFLSIVAAVEEGRSIYNNMKAFIRYLISSNIGEVTSIFLTAALGIPESFVPVQLLWVNLVTDGLPATALGFNPPDEVVMKKKPRRSDDPLITSWIFFRYTVIGMYVGLATVGIFISWFVFFNDPSSPHTLVSYAQLSHWTQCRNWSNFDALPVYDMVPNDPCSYFSQGKAKASTLSLTVLVVLEMLNALNALSEETSLVKLPPWRNPWLLLAIAGSIGLHVMILYVGVLAKIFGVVPLTLMDWIHVLLWSFPILLIDEVMKFVARSRSNSFVTATPQKKRA